MAREIIGTLDGTGLRVGIAAARFNHHVVEGLVQGAIDGLTRNGVADEAVAVCRVPGAWELPMVCKRMAASGDYDAVIALGAVVRGDTPHFDYVCAECSKGIAAVGMEAPVPVIFGVLTTDTVDQAHDRAGLKGGNKGFDAALAAIEMAQVYKAL